MSVDARHPAPTAHRGRTRLGPDVHQRGRTDHLGRARVSSPTTGRRISASGPATNWPPEVVRPLVRRVIAEDLPATPRISCSVRSNFDRQPLRGRPSIAASPCPPPTLSPQPCDYVVCILSSFSCPSAAGESPRASATCGGCRGSHRISSGAFAIAGAISRTPPALVDLFS